MPTECSAPSRSHTTNASVVSSFWMRTVQDPSMPSAFPGHAGRVAAPPLALRRSHEATRLKQPETSRCSLGASTSSSAATSRSTASPSRPLPARLSLLGWIFDDVEEMVSRERASRPERQPVARVERLTDHRHVRTGHGVERGTLVRPWQPELWERVHRHGRPSVRPHRERRVVTRGRAAVAQRAAVADDLYLASPHAGERPFTYRRLAHR